MRCFLGIKLDPDLTEEVSKVKKQFKRIDSDIKFVENENLHFTVKFLGDIDKTEISKIDSIEDVLEKYRPFTVGLKGTGVFPSKDYIKVIWTGAGEGREKFKSLLEDLDSKLAKRGFDKNENEIVPHLTIGRVKSGRNKEKIASTVEKNEDIKLGEMTIDKITLFKSNLKPEGPEYKKINEYSL